MLRSSPRRLTPQRANTPSANSSPSSPSSESTSDCVKERSGSASASPAICSDPCVPPSSRAVPAARLRGGAGRLGLSGLTPKRVQKAVRPFRCGNGVSGTGTPRKEHSGAQPSRMS